ncbi:photosystem I reaction center subunit XI [Leptolyngbya sp. FACHB-261]|uniref:photosystem I reaction center subunit XI n=1 Tax=Leptolyngbya sp. FACHB-261 TaxID=2692806 RepID=UPI00168576EF|nr:photosystem I reaction center subunit XI [Leptolyngbya sp. FACHB-261]MBD2104689.1 photosystem I reaction center subunit XI [Leptolyngbya sp. FACHB-261]
MSDPRNREYIQPVFSDPQIGNLETPINASGFSKSFINNLPAYRKGIAPLQRGLEVGMAHGYWLIGPFARLGPLRDTDVANLAGLLSAVGLVVILTLALSLYGNSAYDVPDPVVTVTAKPPDALKTSEGWSQFAGGFLVGGIGGAGFAYLLLSNLDLLNGISTGVFN